eukprot:5346274-Amphidinium_carterae.1
MAVLPIGLARLALKSKGLPDGVQLSVMHMQGGLSGPDIQGCVIPPANGANYVARLSGVLENSGVTATTPMEMRVSKLNRNDHSFHAIYSEDGRATVGAYSTASFSQIGPSLSKADASSLATYIESGSTQGNY